MEFVVENLAIIICAIVGIGLLVVEMFMPGFGVPGISGVALLALSIFFTWTRHGMLAGLGLAAIELAVAGTAITLSLRSASKGRLSKSPLILKGGQTKKEGFIATEDLNSYVGKTGLTVTVLRPAGTAEFDGERMNVVSAAEFIPKGVKVIIKEVEGARVLVEEVKADE
jgi:membrane-bound ClpP family serine protease